MLPGVVGGDEEAWDHFEEVVARGGCGQAVQGHQRALRGRIRPGTAAQSDCERRLELVAEVAIGGEFDQRFRHTRMIEVLPSPPNSKQDSHDLDAAQDSATPRAAANALPATGTSPVNRALNVTSPEVRRVWLASDRSGRQ